MSIIRHDDGSLTVPVVADRHAGDDAPDGAVDLGPTTKVLRPGEGGYNEALAEWDLQQHPDHTDAVSTASAEAVPGTMFASPRNRAMSGLAGRL